MDIHKLIHTIRNVTYYTIGSQIYLLNNTKCSETTLQLSVNQTVIPSIVSVMCADKVQRKPLRLIVAACNMGIGQNEQLQWHLPWKSCHCAHVLSVLFFDATVIVSIIQPLCDLVETIWVVGGPQVYQEVLMHPWCDLVYLTDKKNPAPSRTRMSCSQTD
ncbi:uncharacterized protein ACWYII_000784 [Salvelinus alpinus]